MSRPWNDPYSAINVYLWVFSATILGPLTSARSYATIADRKRQNSEVDVTEIKPMKESHARRQKRQPFPKRFSGDGSAPPRFRFGFPVISLFAFPWRVLGCGGAKRRRTRLCLAHATVPLEKNYLFWRTYEIHRLAYKVAGKLRSPIHQGADLRAVHAHYREAY